MDALARFRVAHGQKAVSIDLGAMDADGMLSNNSTLRVKALASGHVAIVSRPEFHALLDYYCDPRRELTVETCQIVYGFNTPTTMRAKGYEPGYRMQLPLFQHTFSIGEEGQELPRAAGEGVVSHRPELLAATSLAQAGGVVTRALIERLVKHLPGLESGPDAGKSIHAYGLDSLMAIELRSWFANEFLADVPIFEIVGEISFAELGLLVAKRSGLKQDGWTVE